jgi:hypothetical protein
VHIIVVCPAAGRASTMHVKMAVVAARCMHAKPLPTAPHGEHMSDHSWLSYDQAMLLSC